MGAPIEDLYVLLHAQTAPLTEGLLSAGAAGEEMAARMTTAMAEVTASVERMAAASKLSLEGMARTAVATENEMAAMAAKTAELTAAMEAQTARAAAATEAVGVKMANTAGQTRDKIKTAATVMAGAFDFVAIESIKMAGDFQSSTQKIVSSGGELQENIDKVRQGILGMAADVGYSSEELSGAFYYASSAGFNYANGGLKVLQAAAEGAKTEQADLTLVTDAVTSAMVDYGIKADGAATLTSKLVEATAKGKMSFQDLAAALPSILPVASAAHVSINDILADLASMTVHGMSADQAAQNLADTIRHLQSASTNSVMAKELAALGLSATDVAEKLGQRGLSGTINLISDAITSRMGGDAQRVVINLNDALKMLPKSVQELGAKVLDGSISMKDFTKSAKDLNVINDKQVMSFASLVGGFHQIGTQSLSAAEVYQTYAAAMQKATGDATGLNTALMIGHDNMGTTADDMAAVSDATEEAGGHVKGWAEIQKTFNQRLSDAKAGLGAVAIEVGTHLLPYATKFLGWLADSVKWMEKHKGFTQALAIVIGVLAVAFTVLAAAMWLASITPIVLIIALIIIGIAALAFGIFELVTHWHTAWTWMGHIVENVWQFIYRYIWKDGIFKAFEELKGWLQNLRNWWDDAWKWVVDTAKGVWKWLTDAPGKLYDAFKGIVNYITAPFREAFNSVARMWNDTIGKLSWTVPDWVPGIGGNTISAPKLPYVGSFAQAGLVPGYPGEPVLLTAHGGERVLNVNEAAGGGGGAPPVIHVHVYLDGEELSGATIRQAQRTKLRNRTSLLT